MTKLQAIEEQVRELSASERAELRDFLDELEADAWDEQLARDAEAGKLEALFTEARAEHAAGKSTKL